VGELHAPPYEVPQPYRSVNVDGWFGRVRAALEAERTQQARKAKEMVTVKMSYENLGNSAY